MSPRPGCGCLGCGGLLVALFVLTGSVGVLAGDFGGLARPVTVEPTAAVADIPPDYLALYQQTGRRSGLDWPLLAAVGRVASDHGRLTTECVPDAAGAIGPMGIQRSTFAKAAGLAGLGEGADPCAPADAVAAVAAYLRSRGAPDDWRGALAAYNPSDGYADLVLAVAAGYGHAVAVVWPLDGRISQRFGPTDLGLEPSLWYRGQWFPHFHAGLDIAAPLGTPVQAIAAGVVTFAGRIADGAVVVEIRHAPGVTSTYVHLEPDPPVAEGDRVVAGGVIGTVGVTGITTGAHLHLAIWAAGEPLDPLSVLPPIHQEVTHGR